MDNPVENSSGRVHRVLYEAVLDVLDAVFAHQHLADRVIERVLKSQPKWGSRDRAFIAGNSYEIIRNWRLLHFINGSDTEAGEYAPLPLVFAAHRWHQGLAIPDWAEFADFQADQAAIRLHLAGRSPAILYSMPEWLYEYGSRELGDRWDAEVAAMHKQAPVFIRVNTLKTSPEALIASLAEQDITAETDAKSATALHILNRPNLFRTKAFQAGWFEVQDISSQLVAPLLDPRPGERIIDACAGAGGKTLHISMLMGSKGHIIALDTELKKLETLRQRARRAGISNLETRVIESSKTIKRLDSSADRLLLDVPCSGSGVFRRNPDAKYRLQPAFMDEVRKTQASILLQYSRMLKPGGILVYATCSLFPSENEQQVEAFLREKGDEFSLESSTTISTAASGQDGFYMARLRKKA